MNPAYGEPELMRVLNAIASQVAPNEHYYFHGESERLARPVLMIAQRNLLNDAEWSAWFTGLAGPGPLGRWDNWFRSNAGLSRRHDLMMFLLVLHANISLAQNAGTFTPMRAGLTAAIQAIS